MKRYFVLLILSMILIVTSTTAGTNGFRLGVSFGGTHFLGLNIEKFYGDNSLRLNVGFFELPELCISFSVNRYFMSSEFRPFVGIGVWDVLVFTNKGFGYLTLLNCPLGVDWNVSKYHFLGAEFDLNYALLCRAPDGGCKIRRRFIPLPNIYYKYKW